MRIPPSVAREVGAAYAAATANDAFAIRSTRAGAAVAAAAASASPPAAVEHARTAVTLLASALAAPGSVAPGAITSATGASSSLASALELLGAGSPAVDVLAAAARLTSDAARLASRDADAYRAQADELQAPYL